MLRSWRWPALFVALGLAVSGLYAFWIARGDISPTAAYHLIFMWTGLLLAILVRPRRWR